MSSRRRRLNWAPDLRFDRAGLRFAGEPGPRRLVFRPSSPSLFTLRHEEFRVLELCRDGLDANTLVAESLRRGVTTSRDFAVRVVDELVAAGLLIQTDDETTNQHEKG